jgi:hypothetical protein
LKTPHKVSLLVGDTSDSKEVECPQDSTQPPAHLQQIQGGQQILDHDRWGQDSRASSPELARRPIPAREADTAFDPVRRTGSTTVQTAEEALLYPQVSRSSVVDQSWERIGVTGNHPIWSEDRHDYIAAMDLRVGERLKNLSGDTVWVQQKLPRPGPTPVYNLEVQDEHVYYVGTNGVLAHNVKGKKKGKSSMGSVWMARYDSKGHTLLKFLGHEKQHDHAFHSMLNHVNNKPSITFVAVNLRGTGSKYETLPI